MSELSRCGRVYPTLDAAYKAAELRMSKGAGEQRVVSCSLGEHWHVVPLARAVVPAKPYRPDPFPPVVASRRVLDMWRDLPVGRPGTGPWQQVEAAVPGCAILLASIFRRQ